MNIIRPIVCFSGIALPISFLNAFNTNILTAFHEGSVKAIDFDLGVIGGQRDNYVELDLSDNIVGVTLPTPAIWSYNANEFNDGSNYLLNNTSILNPPASVKGFVANFA